MILLTGATGTSGSEIAKQLSAAGKRFRALVRDRQKAEPLFGLNVELVEGDLGKPETLAPALADVDHALLLSSPDERQVELQGNFIDAAKRAGVSHVVKYSAIGAAPDSISKFLRWHAQTEGQLERSGSDSPFSVPPRSCKTSCNRRGRFNRRERFTPRSATPGSAS